MSSNWRVFTLRAKSPSGETNVVRRVVYNVNDPAYGIDLTNMNRGATGIDGSSTLLHAYSFAGLSLASVKNIARSGDKIYYVYQTAATIAAKQLWVCEYDLVADTETTILVGSEAGAAYNVGDSAKLCYLDGRKILVTDIDLDRFDGESVLYLVDFEASTVSQTLVIDTTAKPNGTPKEYAISAFSTIKDQAGDVHIVLPMALYTKVEDVNSTGYSGIKVYHKNYTQGGSWETSNVYGLPYTNLRETNFTGDRGYGFIGYDKFFITDGYMQYDEAWAEEYYGAVAFTYDLTTNVLDDSNLLQVTSPFFYYFAGVPAPDNTNQKVYWAAYMYDVSYSDETQRLYAFDLSTMTISVNLTLGTVNKQVVPMSTPTLAYYYRSDTNTIHEANGGTQLGTYTFLLGKPGSDAQPEMLNNVCTLLEPTTPGIWYFKTSDSTINLINVDGTVVYSYATGITPGTNRNILFHFCDSLILETSNGLGSVSIYRIY